MKKSNLWMACLWVAFLGLSANNSSIGQINYLPRTNYGQRLEPKNHIYSGAGQSDPKSFERYITGSDSVCLPEIYMDYVGLDHVTTESVTKKVNGWKRYPWNVIPQVGLAMTHDGKPEERYEHKVAEGLLDSNIHVFAEAISKYPGNIMIRLGYEFNGHWNGYKPDPYKAAYIRVAKILREKLGDRLALVWCFAIDGDNHDFMSFFPGDQYVDWWSVDVFGEKHFTHKALQPFLDSAHAHKRPVLIGESTPRKLPVQMGKESVERWYKPYFTMMANNPGIKGFSYIYWNWSKTPWADWGDGCFGENLETKAFMMRELKKDIFQHQSKDPKK